MIDNHVTLIGRMARDIRIMSTQSGKTLGYFGIAVGYGDNVEFVNCTAWGKTAENLAAYTQKGSQIAVEGHLHQRESTVNGKVEHYLEVTVDNIKLLDKKREEKPLEIPDDVVNLADDLPF